MTLAIATNHSSKTIEALTLIPVSPKTQNTSGSKTLQGLDLATTRKLSDAHPIECSICLQVIFTKAMETIKCTNPHPHFLHPHCAQTFRSTATNGYVSSEGHLYCPTCKKHPLEGIMADLPQVIEPTQLAEPNTDILSVLNDSFSGITRSPDRTPLDDRSIISLFINPQEPEALPHIAIASLISFVATVEGGAYVLQAAGFTSTPLFLSRTALVALSLITGAIGAMGMNAALAATPKDPASLKNTIFTVLPLLGTANLFIGITAGCAIEVTAFAVNTLSKFF